MLEKLKLIRSFVKKDINYKEIKNDIVSTINELNDPELACLYIASSNNIDFINLQSLIDIVKNNPQIDNGKWVNQLIVILNNKPSIIKNEFKDEVNDLDYISIHYLNESRKKSL